LAFPPGVDRGQERVALLSELSPGVTKPTIRVGHFSDGGQLFEGDDAGPGATVFGEGHTPHGMSEGRGGTLAGGSATLGFVFTEIALEEGRLFQGGLHGFPDLNGDVPGLLCVIGV